MYKLLFNAVTDAVRELETQNYGAAQAVLKKAQQDCEEIYISTNEKAQA